MSVIAFGERFGVRKQATESMLAKLRRDAFRPPIVGKAPPSQRHRRRRLRHTRAFAALPHALDDTQYLLRQRLGLYDARVVAPR